MAPSSRDAVKMTEEELSDFLDTNMKVQVATIGPDGQPHLATLFYVMVDGQMFFWTYGRSQKIQNLRRDPRITCLVEDGEDYFELRGVSLSGRAELVRDEAGIREIGTAVATAMVGGADLGEIGTAEVERQVRKRVGVVVTPSRVASWDHRKMATSRR
jgi:PPOX class probable F420-dependent enzyme